MSHRLSYEEVKILAETFKDLAEGEQVHINHEECEAGIDTKRRLYIKRKNDGLLFYCHHCCKSGSYSEAKFRSLEAIKGNTKHASSSSATLSLPADYEASITSWPTRARAWVYRYGITDEEITKYGIGYSARERRVILPSWEDGVLLGYQTRKIFDEDTGPKYTTYHHKKNFVWKDLTNTNGVLVICEDVLSAIKLRRYYSSMALLSTHLHKCNYHYLFKYEQILIYLDNNNPEVKLKALSMKKELEMYLPSVSIINIERDPKQLSNEELRNLVL